MHCGWDPQVLSCWAQEWKKKVFLFLATNLSKEGEGRMNSNGDERKVWAGVAHSGLGLILGNLKVRSAYCVLGWQYALFVIHL